MLTNVLSSASLSLPLAQTRAQQYAQPGLDARRAQEGGVDAGIPTFVDGVYPRMGLAVLGQLTESLAVLRGQVQAQEPMIQQLDNQSLLQDQLLQAREVIKVQGEHRCSSRPGRPGAQYRCFSEQLCNRYCSNKHTHFRGHRGDNGRRDSAPSR